MSEGVSERRVHGRIVARLDCLLKDSNPTKDKFSITHLLAGGDLLGRGRGGLVAAHGGAGHDVHSGDAGHGERGGVVKGQG